MADLSGFDAIQIEPNSSFDPVPAGNYLAVVTGSEMKANRAGTGHYLELTFQIQEGEYEGRLLWARLNLDHPNATAVQIAQADLSAICRAVDVMAPKDSAELHNLPLVIQVRCKKRADTGEITNEIKGYSKKESPPPAGNAPAADKVSPQAMVHLTEKPVELAVRAIQYSSRAGERVLDLFGGSGSTLIACEQTGRRSFLMEYDAAYCDVIVERWQRFTGLTAKRQATDRAA